MKPWQKTALVLLGTTVAGLGAYFAFEKLASANVPPPPPPPGPKPSARVGTGSHVIVPGVTVRDVQDALNLNGYSLALDNIWGPKTEAATRDFQGKHSLAVDGIVGPQTWGALQAGRAAGPTIADRPGAAVPASPTPPAPTASNPKAGWSMSNLFTPST